MSYPYVVIGKHHHGDIVYVTNVSFDPILGPRGTFTPYKHEANMLSKRTADSFVEGINDTSYFVEAS